MWAEKWGKRESAGFSGKRRRAIEFLSAATDKKLIDNNSIFNKI
jgi:hypothetical protein